MLQFVGGILVAVLIVTPVVFLLFRKKITRSDANRRVHQAQFEELSKLTGGLAHEIKNPLSTIKVNLKLISENTDTSEASVARNLRKIGVVSKEMDRLELILEDFLCYIGKTEVHPTSVDVNELLKDMLDFYSPQAYAHSITVRVGLFSGPLICDLDSDLFKQAILNLFINAQQAMEDGGELIVRTDKQKEFAIIEISDTGIGITAEKLDKIFDAYYSSKARGSGLGLPTTRKVVEAHDGSITVNSQVGKGTLFCIKLPLKAED